MKVTKSDAAIMVGASRATFYRHITEKKISVEADGTIDLSELHRVYGKNAVVTLEQGKAALKAKKKKDASTEVPTSQPLEEDIKRLSQALETANLERSREREQYREEIDHLKASLEKLIGQNGDLTRLLTDQRSKEDRDTDKAHSAQQSQWDSVLKTLQELKAAHERKTRWWSFSRRA